jgi:hypothetical protein
MGTARQTLNKVLDGRGSKTEFIEAITQWMKTEVAMDTEGSYEAVSRRVVWLFPNDYAFAVGVNFVPVFYKVKGKLNEDAQLPLDASLSKHWLFLPYANGWTYKGSRLSYGENTYSEEESNTAIPSASLILQFLDRFTELHGEPELVLPWDNTWTETIVDQGEEYYEWRANDAAEELEEGEELGENDYETMFLLATSVIEKTLNAVSPWAISLVSEEEMISDHSDYYRFQALTERISEEKIMIVNLDEHCGGCSSGKYESAVAADPELEGKNIFITWSQASDWRWRGDGGISVEVHIQDPADELAVSIIAEELGLYVGLDETDWKPKGSFTYDS